MLFYLFLHFFFVQVKESIFSEALIIMIGFG